jgi:uncharacterized membrane protein YqiK
MNQQETPNSLLPTIVAMAIVVALLWLFVAAIQMITSCSENAQAWWQEIFDMAG